ncbi:MAG: glycosyltransferase family 2 protein [Candidatus Bathyarchaeia archaeon]
MAPPLEISKILIGIIGSIFLIASLFYLVIVWNAKRPEHGDEFFPTVSLMAYAWQSGNVIERKIRNFLEQDYPKDRFEVIIYDNDSTDETADICLEYERRGLIKYYRPSRAYDRKAPVLDQAIERVAKGEIIALTDPDGVCERGWLRKIVQPFKDQRVGAVAGITHCGNYHKNLFTKLRAIEDEWGYNICVLGRSGKVKISDFQPLCGANYALRRSAWESVDRSHGSGLIEDYEMTLRLYERGWRIAAADAHVWQEEVEDLRQYIRQRRRWYSFSLRKLVSGRGRMDKMLGALPMSMQAMALLSLIYFILASSHSASNGPLTVHGLALAAPLLLTYSALALGLLKVGKAKLLPYIPIFLTLDGALQMAVFLGTKILSKGEPKWVKLADGKYYHVGTEIRMD